MLLFVVAVMNRLTGMFAIVVAIACDTGSAHEAAVSDALQRLAEADCEAKRVCCDRDGYDPAPLESCEAQTYAKLTAILSLSQSQVSVDTAALDACLARFKARAQTCTYGEQNLFDDPCAIAFRGAVPVGGVCYRGADCGGTERQPMLCDIGSEPDPTFGICRPISFGQLGDECRLTAPEHFIGTSFGLSSPDVGFVVCSVNDGLYCQSRANTCAPLSSSGGACMDGEGCPAGQWCHESVCTPVHHEGESCDPGICGPGLSCVQNRCTSLPYGSRGTCSGL